MHSSCGRLFFFLQNSHAVELCMSAQTCHCIKLCYVFAFFSPTAAAMSVDTRKYKHVICLACNEMSSGS